MPYKPAESYSITKDDAPEMFRIANIIGEAKDWSVAQTIEALTIEAGLRQIEEQERQADAQARG